MSIKLNEIANEKEPAVAFRVTSVPDFGSGTYTVNKHGEFFLKRNQIENFATLI